MDEHTIVPLEYQTSQANGQPSELNLLLVVLTESVAVVLLLVALWILFVGCFALIGGPDPMKEYQSTYVGLFVQSLFSALGLEIIITLLLAVAFTRASRHRVIAPYYVRFLLPSAMITGGILLLVPFMISSPMFLIGFCVWENGTATTIGVSFICASVVGAVLAVMGFVQVSRVRNTPNSVTTPECRSLHGDTEHTERNA